jgi:gamma-glutamyltranspeptidase
VALNFPIHFSLRAVELPLRSGSAYGRSMVVTDGGAGSQPDKQGPLRTVELRKKIEAMKLAYTDLYRYHGDPRFASMPVRGLLAKEYAEQRGALIDPEKAYESWKACWLT